MSWSLEPGKYINTPQEGSSVRDEEKTLQSLDRQTSLTLSLLSSRLIWSEFMERKQKHHSVGCTIKRKPPLLTGQRWGKDETEVQTQQSLFLVYFPVGQRLFRRQRKASPFHPFTTDKHRHIKTSLLKSGNSPFNSRQTQCEEVNYRTGATQPFRKLHLQ